MIANQAEHSVTVMAEALGVSVSGFCAFQKRLPSNRQQRQEEPLKQIETIHVQSRGTYGAPRITEELREQDVAIGQKRVARLMRKCGLKGVHRRKWPMTTKRAKRERPAPDLV